MEIETVHYSVTIIRDTRDGFFDPRYHLEVKANSLFVTQTYCHTKRGAMRKALRAIKCHQKDFDKGVKFGIVYNANGDFESVKKALKEKNE